MIEIHESRRDGMVRSDIQMRNELAKKKNLDNRTTTRFAVSKHPPNNHRSLERRLEATGR